MIWFYKKYQPDKSIIIIWQSLHIQSFWHKKGSVYYLVIFDIIYLNQFKSAVSTCPYTKKSGDKKVLTNSYLEYEPRRHVYLRDLPKNHLAKIQSVKFEFTDYKVYDKLGCYPYERMTIQCVNHYGANFLLNKECRDINSFFQECIKVNEVLGHKKRTNPEYFATNTYSREKPNFEELALWFNMKSNIYLLT